MNFPTISFIRGLPPQKFQQLKYSRALFRREENHSMFFFHCSVVKTWPVCTYLIGAASINIYKMFCKEKISDKFLRLI